jgi:hypothetical protein
MHHVLGQGILARLGCSCGRGISAVAVASLLHKMSCHDCQSSTAAQCIVLHMASTGVCATPCGGGVGWGVEVCVCGGGGGGGEWAGGWGGESVQPYLIAPSMDIGAHPVVGDIVKCLETSVTLCLNIGNLHIKTH